MLDRQWYAVQTQPQAERKTAGRLDKIDGFDCYLPCALVDVVRRGKVVAVSVPAFPSYVFALMPASAAAWHAARDEWGVSRLLGNNDEGVPFPISDKEIAALQHREAAGELEAPRAARIKYGARVRIRFGALVNYVGRLMPPKRRKKKNRRNTFWVRPGGRVTVEVALLGGAVAVDLPSDSIEAAPDLPPSDRGAFVGHTPRFLTQTSARRGWIDSRGSA